MPSYFSSKIQSSPVTTSFDSVASMGRIIAVDPDVGASAGSSRPGAPLGVAGGGLLHVATFVARDVGEQPLRADGPRLCLLDVDAARVFVLALHEEPLAVASANEGPASLQLRAGEDEAHLAGRDRLRGVDVLHRRPHALVPDHHGAAAVLAFGDDPL